MLLEINNPFFLTVFFKEKYVFQYSKIFFIFYQIQHFAQNEDMKTLYPNALIRFRDGYVVSARLSTWYSDKNSLKKIQYIFENYLC